MKLPTQNRNLWSISQDLREMRKVWVQPWSFFFPWLTRAVSTIWIKWLRFFYYFVGFALWKFHEMWVLRNPSSTLFLPWMHCLHWFHTVLYHGTATRYQEASKSFWYSYMCKLPFLSILQSINITTLPKTEEIGDRVGSAFVHRCVIPSLYGIVQKVQLL